MSASGSFNSTSALSARQLEFLEEASRAFYVSDAELTTLIRKLESELALGLTTNTSCDLFMSPSPTNSSKQATGTALSLAIESSGRRVRISSVTFSSDSSIANTQTQVLVPTAEEAQDARSLFEYISVHLGEFILNHGLETEAYANSLPLGFTIGFPVSGSFVGEATKEDSLDLHDIDIGQMLVSAAQRHHLPVRVTSVTNNVVSALVAAQFSDNRTRVAASFNHGINAAYYEPSQNIVKTCANMSGQDVVAINTELGRFGSSSGVLPQTMWDHRIDRESRNPGHQAFEKLVADQYLGELVRNLITDLMDKHLLFRVNCRAEKISTDYAFHTAYMGHIMDDEHPELLSVSGIFEAEFGITTSLADRQIIRGLCEIVAARASRLSGAALAALVLKSNANVECSSVALSGALFDMNRKVYERTVETLQEMLEMRSENARPSVCLQRRNLDLLGAAVNAIR
ncbi:hexokinase, partial [Linderina macrospora]